MTTAAPKARERKKRTRTRKLSNLPALVTSELPPQQVQIHPDRVLVVCPDCKTWCPVNGTRSNRIAKLVPHDDGKAGVARRHGCRSSNRRIEIDLTPGQLKARLEEAETATRHRQATRVSPKPKTPKAPAVLHLVPSRTASPEQAERHRLNCPVCRSGGTCRNGYQPHEITSPERATLRRANEALALHRLHCPVCQHGLKCRNGRTKNEAVTCGECKKLGSYCREGSLLRAHRDRAQDAYTATSARTA